MSTTVVTSQTNPLAYLKAIATLIGSIVTALLGVYTADTPVGKVLTIIAIVATALATWTVPNATVISPDDGDDAEDDGLTYEESGGLPFPVDADEPTLYQRDPLDRPVRPEDGDPSRP